MKFLGLDLMTWARVALVVTAIWPVVALYFRRCHVCGTRRDVSRDDTGRKLTCWPCLRFQKQMLQRIRNMTVRDFV